MTPAEAHLSNKAITVSCPDTLTWLLPSFQPTSVIEAYYLRPILYLGNVRQDTRARLQSVAPAYVCLVHHGEVTIKANSQWLHIALLNHHKSLTDKQAAHADELDWSIFRPILQHTLLTGKVSLGSEKDEASIYQLFQSLAVPMNELCQCLFAAISCQPIQQVESSLLTMLSRLNEPDSQSVSPQYRKLLNQLGMKVKNNIIPATRNYISDTKTLSELALLKYLLELRGQ